MGNVFERFKKSQREIVFLVDDPEREKDDGNGDDPGSAAGTPKDLLRYAPKMDNDSISKLHSSFRLTKISSMTIHHVWYGVRVDYCCCR